MRGRCTSARARSSLASCLPSSPTRLSAAWVRPTRSSKVLERCRASSPVMPCSAVCSFMCSRPVRNGSRAASCSAAPMAARTAGPSSTTSAPDARAALGGRQQRREHVDGGGFPGAVRAQEAVHLPGLDPQVDAVHGAGPFLKSRTRPIASIAGSAIRWKLARVELLVTSRRGLGTHLADHPAPQAPRAPTGRVSSQARGPS